MLTFLWPRRSRRGLFRRRSILLTGNSAGAGERPHDKVNTSELIHPGLVDLPCASSILVQVIPRKSPGSCRGYQRMTNILSQRLPGSRAVDVKRKGLTD